MNQNITRKTLLFCIFIVGYAQISFCQVIPDNNVTGVLKMRPLRVLSVYHALQFGYEHRLTEKIYADGEFGYIYGTYKGIDAFFTDEKIKGTILGGELRYYFKPFVFETGIDVDDFWESFNEGNHFIGFNLFKRSTGFSDDYETNGTVDNVKFRSNRVSINAVYGISRFISQRFVFEPSVQIGYSIHNNKVKNNSAPENEVIDHFLEQEFYNIDGKSFFNFVIRLRIGLAY